MSQRCGASESAVRASGPVLTSLFLLNKLFVPDHSASVRESVRPYVFCSLGYTLPELLTVTMIMLQVLG